MSSFQDILEELASKSHHSSLNLSAFQIIQLPTDQWRSLLKTLKGKKIGTVIINNQNLVFGNWPLFFIRFFELSKVLRQNVDSWQLQNNNLGKLLGMSIFPGASQAIPAGAQRQRYENYINALFTQEDRKKSSAISLLFLFFKTILISAAKSVNLARNDFSEFNDWPAFWHYTALCKLTQLDLSATQADKSEKFILFFAQHALPTLIFKDNGDFSAADLTLLKIASVQNHLLAFIDNNTYQRDKPAKNLMTEIKQILTYKKRDQLERLTGRLILIMQYMMQKNPDLQFCYLPEFFKQAVLKNTTFTLSELEDKELGERVHNLNTFFILRKSNARFALLKPVANQQFYRKALISLSTIEFFYKTKINDAKEHQALHRLLRNLVESSYFAHAKEADSSAESVTQPFNLISKKIKHLRYCTENQEQANALAQIHKICENEFGVQGKHGYAELSP